MISRLTESIIYIGANDHDIDLFEGHFEVPLGMSYNSYVVLDDKTVIFDTIDKSKTEEWLGNIEEALDGRSPDYLVIQHMEPDHSASLEAFVNKYPKVRLIGSNRAFKMAVQFFPELDISSRIEVSDGDTLNTGKHTFTFVSAPMVHWPEVIMTYESSEKILFSADGFGKFGALDVVDEEGWACEARRYYFGIIGKYGAQVQTVLKKISGYDISMICPLHGPVLDEDIDYYITTYDTWSSYEPEDRGVAIFYTSVYGNTKKAVELLADELRSLGEDTVEVIDLAREDMYESVEDAFRYDRIVLATTTYNGDIFPFMKEFTRHLAERNYQNRTVGMIENGSWAPNAIRTMKKELSECRNITYTDSNVTIFSALSERSINEIKALAKELSEIKPPAANYEPQETKKWVCQVCGHVVEADSLPDDFQCPLCKVGKDNFKEIK